ncbi:pyridoxamine 5'-phosphate oxidase family protein [Pseudonocardia halophobica]|uniref:pyridoxamine 5'-phosphate oxidase family protein n=1 Tax=Pseudonocardia halophobica TaxID=29401 RepID=UPI0012DD810C|nr:pyridoxamine 5'-phosphate oxidase family protein [Pseudonocardia halophobica]
MASTTRSRPRSASTPLLKPRSAAEIGTRTASAVRVGHDTSSGVGQHSLPGSGRTTTWLPPPGSLLPSKGVKRWAFVERALRLRLTSALPNRAIDVSPPWFVVVDETVSVPPEPTLGDPGQSTNPDARHMKVIDAGGRVSAVIDDGDETSNERAVQREGTADQVDDPELVEQLLDLVVEK